MREDISTIEFLKNNAKCFGEVIGTEETYLRQEDNYDDVNDFFEEQSTLKY